MRCKELVFTCELIHGLHARPASALVELAADFDANMEIENLRTGVKADLNSPLSLIAADIAYRDICKIRIVGSDADTASQQLKQFVFNELQQFDAVQLDIKNSQQLPPSLRSLNLKYCSGHSVGMNWAEGVPVCLSEHRFRTAEHSEAYAGLTGEKTKLLSALEQLQINIKSNINQAETETERSILRAHFMLASDSEFKSCLLDFVNKGDSAWGSIKQALDYYSAQLQNSDSGYLRERVLDIQDICDQLLKLSCYNLGHKARVLESNSIFIADNLTPSQFLGLDKCHTKGLVLESGGKTSHTVLLAQARGIPVIVGAEGARALMKQVSKVILDARLGVLIADPSEEVERYYQQEAGKQQKLESKYQPFIAKEARTLDQQPIEVGANIIGLDDAAQALSCGAEGIGLFRTEMMFMGRTRAPDMAEQFSVYKAVVEAAGARPVIIRTIDVGADKPVEYFNLPEEQNPFLGFRAVRLYSEFLDIFKDQLRAILKASCSRSLGLMIPMVSTLSEVRWVKQIISEVSQELIEAGEQPGEIKLGVMIEVPSACMIIDQLSDYVDFFSIGSNDLTQYALAADRCNDRIAELYNYLQPSFLRLLNKVVVDARKKNKWVGLCGEMASDINALPILVGLGIDEISIASNQIPAIKERISHLDSQKCRELFQNSLTATDYREVNKLLKNSYSELAPRPLLDSAVIAVDFDCLSREEAVKQLADMLYLGGRVADGTAIEEAVWLREKAASTNLGNGIAIPHCHSELVYSHSMAVLKLAKPIQWQPGDDSAVDTIFFLAVRKTDEPDAHMKLFASLARKLMENTFIANFRACVSSEAIERFLKSELQSAG